MQVLEPVQPLILREGLGHLMEVKPTIVQPMVAQKSPEEMAPGEATSQRLDITPKKLKHLGVRILTKN